MKSTNGDTMLGGEDFDEVLLKVSNVAVDDLRRDRYGTVR